MLIKFPSTQNPLGILKHFRNLAREPRSLDEADDTKLVRLDRTQARIAEHVRRADEAYVDYAALPPAA